MYYLMNKLVDQLVGLYKTATYDHELVDYMTELYPHWVANQSWLMFGFPGHNSHQPEENNGASPVCPRIAPRIARPRIAPRLKC